MNFDHETITLTLFVITTILVILPFTGMVLNHAVTLVHELGHAIMALVFGGEVKAIRIETDGSGSTVSGHQIKLGYTFNRIIVLLSGYSFPLYLGSVLLTLSFFNNAASLWVLLALAIISLIFIRNLFGLLIVLIFFITALVGFIFPNFPTYIIPAILGTIFFIGGGKDVMDISRAVMKKRVTNSDFNLLKEVTGISSIFWIIFFYIYNALIIIGLLFLINLILTNINLG